MDFPKALTFAFLGLIALAVTAGCGAPAAEEGANDPEAGHGVVDADHTPPAGVRVNTILVTLKEGAVILSPQRTTAGWTKFVVSNDGSSAHEMEIMADGQRMDQIEQIAPGGHAELTVLLSPNRYTIGCRLTGAEAGAASTHYAAGEHSELTLE